MEILAFIPLFWMIYTDLKERVINLFPLIVFGVLVLIGVGLEDGWLVYGQRLLRNSLLLLLLFSGVLLYLRLRYGRSVRDVFYYLGGGDLGFLFCLSPAFEILEFTGFLIVSFTLSVLIFLFIPAWHKKGIPLVATVGMCYIGYMLFLKCGL